MSDCIFCKIIQKEIPAYVVYEDEHTLAFLSSGPVNPGHTLVIPKKHFEDIYAMDEHSLAAVFQTVKKVSEAVKQGTEAEGINVMMNNERAAGQVVFHAHIHIIPRYFKDGFKHWEHKKDYKKGEAEEVAEKIRNST